MSTFPSRADFVASTMPIFAALGGDHEFMARHATRFAEQAWTLRYEYQEIGVDPASKKASRARFSAVSAAAAELLDAVQSLTPVERLRSGASDAAFMALNGVGAKRFTATLGDMARIGHEQSKGRPGKRPVGGAAFDIMVEVAAAAFEHATGNKPSVHIKGGRADSPFARFLRGALAACDLPMLSKTQIRDRLP